MTPRNSFWTHLVIKWRFIVKRVFVSLDLTSGSKNQTNVHADVETIVMGWERVLKQKDKPAVHRVLQQWPDGLTFLAWQCWLINSCSLETVYAEHPTPWSSVPPISYPQPEINKKNN